MKITEEDRELLDLKRKMESKLCQDTLMTMARIMVLAQEALKADYGLMGQDMPLFNGQYGLLQESESAHGGDMTQPAASQAGRAF
jgi:hypothetical protein